jgi:nucleotide-binding universal stress UspA family protein
MYRNIMVPVDGSPFSREAVLHGLRLASQSGAILRLVRVGTSSTITGGPDGFAVENQRLREIHSAELAELYSIAAECRAHSTVNVTASLQYGPVVDTLIGYARRQNVDLIVMRSHGRKGFARAWFGSVADALIRESGIPVLVVKAPSVATALESGFVFDRILVPLDGSLLAEQSITPAVSLARINGATITLLKVVTPVRQRLDGQLESSIGPAPASEVANAQRYLETCLTPELERSVKVTRRVIVADDVAGTILAAADSMEADLVAIATRGRGAIARVASGSVADRVVRESPVSTMVIHPALQDADFRPAAMKNVAALSA